METRGEPAVRVRELDFSYDDVPIFEDLFLEVPRHSRCLLLGANGVGKSTLLRLLAGKHLIDGGTIEVLGEDPFSGNLGLHDVTLVGERFPFDLDIPVGDLLERAPARDARLEAELVSLLAVDPGWRMHRVSNGQRRRVDLLLSLRNAPKVVLLDEVTADLDILSRQDLLGWLKRETDAGRMTVIFATHILDGMRSWATDLAFLSPRRLRYAGSIDGVPGQELAAPCNGESPLLSLCQRWMEEDRNG